MTTGRGGALVLVVAIAGCGGGGGGDKQASTTTPTETVVEKIAPPKPRGVRTYGGQNLTEADTTAFAKRMTRALRERNEKAFLALIDPGEPAVVAQQRAWFRNVMNVPMKTRSVYLVGNRTNIDSSGRHELTADLGFEHQIRGFDPRPLAEWYEYGFHKSKQGLLVASVTGAKADATSKEKSSRYYRQAWDDGDMAVVRGSRAMILGPEADRAALQAAIGAADDAVRRQTSLLRGFGGIGDSRGRRYVFTIQAPAVGDIFDYFGGRLKPTEANFDGFAQSVFKTDRKTGEVLDFGHPPVTTRIVLKRTLLGSADLASTMRHEMVHAVTDARGVTGLPTWVVEGIAVYFSDSSADELAYRRDNGRQYFASAHTLPKDGRFYKGNDDVVSQNYGAGYLAVSYLADRYGDAGLIRRLRRFYRTGDLFVLIGRATPAQFASRVKRWAGA